MTFCILPWPSLLFLFGVLSLLMVIAVFPQAAVLVLARHHLTSQELPGKRGSSRTTSPFPQPIQKQAKHGHRKFLLFYFFFFYFFFFLQYNEARLLPLLLRATIAFTCSYFSIHLLGAHQCVGHETASPDCERRIYAGWDTKAEKEKRRNRRKEKEKKKTTKNRRGNQRENKKKKKEKKEARKTTVKARWGRGRVTTR